MEFFAKQVTKQVHPNDTLSFRATPEYVEATVHGGELDWIVYLIPISEYRTVVTTCCDDLFTFLDSADDAILEDIQEQWPTVVQLVRNSSKQKFSDSLLLRMDDLDSGDLKWFVATVLGNFDLIKMFEGSKKTKKNPKLDPSLENAIHRVLLKTSGAYLEILNKNIDTWAFWWKNMTRGFFVGAKTGAGMIISDLVKASVGSLVKDVIDHMPVLDSEATDIPQVFTSGHPMGPGPLRF